MESKKRILFLFFVFLIVGTSGCDKIPFLTQYFPSLKKEKPAVKPTTPVITGTVLAKVNNWVLTLEDFNEKLKALREVVPDYDIEDIESKKLVLEELIRQELLVQDAQKKGIAQRKDVVDAVEEFRRTLLVREVASEITKNIEVGILEAEDYYNENKDLFSENVQWKIREIILPTQKQAKEVLVQALQGNDFATLAKENSISASAKKGGDLGYITEIPFPQMESALATLEKGDISSVFKGPAGYYIIKLEDKKGGVPRSFSEVREEIQTGLTLLKQQQEVLGHIEKLKEKADIQINEDLLK